MVEKAVMLCALHDINTSQQLKLKRFQILVESVGGNCTQIMFGALVPVI